MTVDFFFKDAISSLDMLVSNSAAPSANMFLQKANEWKNFIGSTSGKVYKLSDLEDWKKKTEKASTQSGSAAKLEVLKQVRADPMMGIMLVMATIPAVARRRCPMWWGLQFAEQQADKSIRVPAANSPDSYCWSVKELPAASANNKYLIFSDIHRDSKADWKPDFETGAIDHFKSNAELYLQCLKYADANNYTVIEGGDCEELWFVGDSYPQTGGKLDPAKKIKETFDTYPAVFDQLADMHGRERYFRVQGNHDSYIKEPATFDALKTRMERGNNIRFKVYDACIINGVKTMMDHSILDKLVDLAVAATDLKATALANALAKGWLGMDSNDYKDRCRFLICHGHQFDFWNCPENEMLGMMIANAVGVTADTKMDPLLDARGIALQGNPFIQFDDVFASLPVFNSWPTRSPSIKFAHEMQHRNNASRLVTDDIMFSETVPTLWAALGLSLNHIDDNGVVRTPAQTRAEVQLLTPGGIKTYVERHNFNHVCLGHTHNPHSQPFLTFGNITGLVPIVGSLIQKLGRMIPFLPTPKFKTGYFNSGTAGWMEAVVWAIEIDQNGQARLVYWVNNLDDIQVSGGDGVLIKPQYMDWELSPLNPTAKAKIAQAVAEALSTTYQTVSQPVKDVYDALKSMIDATEGSLKDFEKSFQDFMVMPTHLLAGALMTPHSTYERSGLHPLYKLEELALEKLAKKWYEGLQGDASDAIRKQLDEKLKVMRDFFTDIMLSVKRRSMQGFPPSTMEWITIQIPLPTGAYKEIEEFGQMVMPFVEDQLKEFNVPPLNKNVTTVRQAANHAGALLYSIFSDFPRSLPFFNSMPDPLNLSTRARASAHPVMNTMFSTLWMYPYAGTYVDVKGVRIRSSLALHEKWATLTVWIMDPAADGKPSGFNPLLIS